MGKRKSSRKPGSGKTKQQPLGKFIFYNLYKLNFKKLKLKQTKNITFSN